MIKLNPYSSDFEKKYWKVVEEKVEDTVQKQILSSCVKFLPNDFFDHKNPEFKEIVLAPFNKLKAAQKYIENNYQNGIKDMESECIDSETKDANDLYKKLQDAFCKVADAQRNKTTMRVQIVKEADLTVCPYCNRDYINCRDGRVAGAQLDHFFSIKRYPIFAVSLYNLVPTCANCNRIKNNLSEEFASPFDKDIDWDSDIYFKFHSKGFDDFVIEIKAKPDAIKNNITKMRIEEAYQIHSLELKELQEKKLAYSESQEEEIKEVLKKHGISNNKIKKIVFGPEITSEDMRKKPLGKMISDLHKEWGIYHVEDAIKQGE